MTQPIRHCQNNTVRSRTGVYHLCWGLAGEAGRANCNQNLFTRLATHSEVEKASARMFCIKCFPQGKS